VEGCCRKGCGSGFGAKVKAFAYLQADDSDALGRPLPHPWPPKAGRLYCRPSTIPASLHFTHCHLGCLGGSLGPWWMRCCRASSLADDMLSWLCCLVGALPPVYSSSLADALPTFLYSGGCFAAVVMLFDGCFATVSWLLSFGFFGDSISYLCRFDRQVWCITPSVFLLLSVCCVCSSGRLRVCLFVLFFNVSLCLVLCALVLIKLCLATSSFVSITAFFLMKYMPMWSSTFFSILMKQCMLIIFFIRIC